MLFVMVLPTITSLAVDALKAVPTYFRSASLALGATRFQTIYKVLLRSHAPPTHRSHFRDGSRIR